MNLADLKHIFKAQIEAGTDRLYFMIEDHGHKTVVRHDVNDIESLLPMLDCFLYAGSAAGIPRFEK